MDCIPARPKIMLDSTRRSRSPGRRATLAAAALKHGVAIVGSLFERAGTLP